jgi:hypothetical protein
LAIEFLPVAAMPKSLLEQLPEIVARGRLQAGTKPKACCITESSRCGVIR